MPYRVRSPCTLLTALEGMFAGRSRKDLRRLILDRRVLLNGLPAAGPHLEVKEGDLIEVAPYGRPRAIHPQVSLLFEDEHLLVVAKDAGILTTGGVKGRAPSVAAVLGRYLARRGRRGRAHACHRLDRGVSGLLLFAKRARLARAVRDEPRRTLVERVYHALVEGLPAASEATLRGWFREGPDRRMHASSEAEGGKLCVLHYRLLEAGRRHATLEVRLESGRKHQIRAQLSGAGHPVAGDREYGAGSDPAGRIALHAAKLVVLHPMTGKKLEFLSPPPAAFARPPVR
jgi:23S rRNA pseudouridine1911/1915/1917 synthase